MLPGILWISGIGLTLNSLAPYEKRVIELLRNAKDKRARRLAKKRVRLSAPNPTARASRFDQKERTANIHTARYLRPCQEEG